MMREMDRAIDDAVRRLERGDLVAFPTETVYGLGADASNPVAVARIFAAKQRPPDHPLIVHLASSEQVADWAREFPEPARKLAQQLEEIGQNLDLTSAPEVLTQLERELKKLHQALSDRLDEIGNGEL